MRVRHIHKIGRRTYRLKYRAAYDEYGNPLAGAADHKTRTIIVSPHMLKDKTEHDRTVWHELLHTLSWEYGLNMTDPQIERLSIALANYIDDNGLDFSGKASSCASSARSPSRSSSRSRGLSSR